MSISLRLTTQVEQLVVSFLVALVYMLVCAVAAPFKDKGDDFFANACSFALVALFFFCIVMKISVLTEEVDYVLSTQLRGKYGFDVQPFRQSAPPRQRPSSPPVPPRGAPGGSGQLGAPRARPRPLKAPSH